MPPAFQRGAAIASWACVAIAGGALAWLTLRGWNAARNPHADFYDFYWAALAARHGADMYASGDGGYVYPPLLATLLMPLTLLEPQAAMRAWVIACALLLAWCVWEGSRLALHALGADNRRTPIVFCAGVTLLVLADSFRSEFQWANSNIPMLAAILLALRLARARPIASGVLLAGACFIKYLPIGFLAYFAVRRQWRALGGMVLGLSIFALAPAIWLGWQQNVAGLSIALRGMGTMSGAIRAGNAANVIPIDAPYSLSITSGIARLLGPDRTPVELAALVALAAIASIGAGAALYRMHGRRLLGSQHTSSAGTPALVQLAEWSCVIAGALAFSPQTQKRHFNLLVPFVACLIAMLMRLPACARWWAIAALVLLVAGVTPMPNIPGTRDFIDNTWKWSGGPGWLLVVCSLMLMHGVLLRPLGGDALPTNRSPDR